MLTRSSHKLLWLRHHRRAFTVDTGTVQPPPVAPDLVSATADDAPALTPEEAQPPQKFRLFLDMKKEHDPISGCPPKFYPHKDPGIFLQHDAQLSSYQSKSPKELIAEIPPIEVNGNYTCCNGQYFGGAYYMGHPIHYIQLNTVVAHSPQTCKWCGLRFVKAKPGVFPDDH